MDFTDGRGSEMSPESALAAIRFLGVWAGRRTGRKARKLSGQTSKGYKHPGPKNLLDSSGTDGNM